MDSEDTQASLLPSEEAPDRGADEKSKVGPPRGLSVFDVPHECSEDEQLPCSSRTGGHGASLTKTG